MSAAHSLHQHLCTEVPVRPPCCRKLAHTRAATRPSHAAQNCSQKAQSLRCRAAQQDTAVSEGRSESNLKALIADCDSSREAIAAGQKVFADGNYEDAIELFEKGMDGSLPGTGTKRFRDKPPLPSVGEKQAALYNLACCYSQLGDVQTGLTALAGCLENGYRDVDQVRSDPDLEELRKDPRFEGLIKRLVPLAGSGILGRLMNNLTGETPHQEHFVHSSVRAQMSDEDRQPRIKLTDPRLHLILDHHVIQHLSVEALGSLACTCKSLRTLLQSEQRTTLTKLGPQHPVLHQPLPSRQALRDAVQQYTHAGINMKTGSYAESAETLVGQALRFSPDCSMVAVSQAMTEYQASISVYQISNVSLKLVMTKSFGDSISDRAWARDGKSLVIAHGLWDDDDVHPEDLAMTCDRDLLGKWDLYAQKMEQLDPAKDLDQLC
ncbi:hypothetical protein WJX73_002132 [Symbiochloris irregularis]|uniref:Uncharacterized protein n=1 Tax=Symbiochloris irregularis TaxID=706552 RepID=A0AAW1NZR1_9CHLO